MKCATHEKPSPAVQPPGFAVRVAFGLATSLSGSAGLADVVPEGTYTTPFQVVSGQEKTFVGGTIITPIPPYPPPMGGTGIQVQGGLAILDPSLGAGTPIRIRVSGNAIDGLYVRSGGRMEIRPGGVYVYATGGSVRGIYNVGSTGLPAQFDGSDVYVTTDFLDSHALRTYGADATTVMRNSTLTTLQNGSKGAEVWQGAKAELYDTAIATQGTTAYGVHVLNPGSEITTTNGSITTQGTSSYGILVQDAGTFIGNGTTVRAQGAIGAYVITNGVFQANGMSIQSDRTYGLYASSGSIALKDTQVSTLGTGTFAIYVTGVVPVSVVGGQVQTVGDRSVAVRMQSGAVADINGTRISTQGQAAYGIHVEGWGTVNLGRDGQQGSTVSTQGTDADAVRVSPNATRFSATGATLQTTGVNAQGLRLTGTAGAAAKSFTLVDSTITSTQADAIHLSEGPAIISLTGSSITGGNAAINVGATAAATADVTASATLIEGRVLTPAGSTSNLSMSNNSTWRMTANSTVTTLVNADSLIDFTPPQSGAYKTLTTRDYSGNGIIALNTFLESDSSPSDKLVVDGGTATGTSKLRIKNTGGMGAVTTASGIQVVEVVNGGVSGAGAFALSGRAVAGPYEYRLYQGSAAAPADQSWYLRSEKEPDPPPVPPDPPPVPPDPPAPPDPTPDPEPLYRPEVAAYLANQRLAGQMFVQSMHDRTGEPQFIESQPFADADSKRKSVWLRTVGKWEGSHSRDGNFDVSTDLFLLQGGGDLAQRKLFSDTDRLHLGAMLGYGTADSTARADGNPYKAKGRVNGYSAGLYATWFQNDKTKLGAYVDTWFQYGWFNNRVQGSELPRVDYDSRGWAVSAEAGYAFKLRENWMLEPQAQVIYVDTNTDSITEPNGTRIHRADSNGTLTRVGMRTFTTFDLGNQRKAQPFATVNWWHSNVDSSVSFNQLPIGGLYPKDRYELKVGVHADFTKGWTGWVNASGSWGAQDYHQYAGRIGVKYTW